MAGLTVVAATALVSLAAGGVLLLARWGGLAVALVVWAWAAYWQPAVVLDDDAVTLGNVFRTVRIPWGAIRRVEASWQLTVSTDRATWSAWAAPRSSGLSRRAGSARARWPRRDVDPPAASRESADPALRPSATAESLTVEIGARLKGRRPTDEVASLAWRTRTLAACLGVTAIAVVLALAAG